MGSVAIFQLSVHAQKPAMPIDSMAGFSITAVRTGTKSTKLRAPLWRYALDAATAFAATRRALS